MKKLLFLFLSSLVIFSACSPDNSSYETRYSDNGDSTVYVRYIDDRGNDHSFFMDYVLFSTLYNHGGYNSCYGYYNTHRSYYDDYHYNKYNGYRPRTVIHNNHYYNNDRGYNNDRRRISAPSTRSNNNYNTSRSTRSNSYSPSTRSSYSSPSTSSTRSYSSSPSTRSSSSSSSRSSSSRSSSTRH